MNKMDLIYHIKRVFYSIHRMFSLWKAIFFIRFSWIVSFNKVFRWFSIDIGSSFTSFTTSKRHDIKAIPSYILSTNFYNTEVQSIVKVFFSFTLSMKGGEIINRQKKKKGKKKDWVSISLTIGLHVKGKTWPGWETL